MKWKKPIAALTVSAAGFAAILSYEGFSPTAYKPVPGDVWTIGYGTTEGVRAGDVVSMEEALVLARKDIKRFQGYMAQCVDVPVTQGEFDAYVSFVYNVGPTQFCQSTLVKKLNAGDSKGACNELKLWVCGPDPTGAYAKRYPGHHCGRGKAPLPGLVARRDEEFKRCMRDLK